MASVRISQQPPMAKNHRPSPLFRPLKFSSPLPPGRHDGGGSPRYHVASRTNLTASGRSGAKPSSSQNASCPHAATSLGDRSAPPIHLSKTSPQSRNESSSNH